VCDGALTWPEVCSTLVGGMGQDGTRGVAKDPRPPSAREVELLALAARGMSNREIAETLLLSEATVKRHLANVYGKMGVHSRSEAVAEALRSGLLSYEWVWGADGPAAPRYRCEAAGCGCEVVVARAPSDPDAWRPPVCHGTEMAQV
jgi:DNA-binding CsgD family transcriptional regulator